MLPSIPPPFFLPIIIHGAATIVRHTPRTVVATRSQKVNNDAAARRCNYKTLHWGDWASSVVVGVEHTSWTLQH